MFFCGFVVGFGEFVVFYEVFSFGVVFVVCVGAVLGFVDECLVAE